MKYIVLTWDEYKSVWVIYWYGTSRREADKAYTEARGDWREVKLVKVETIKEVYQG